MFIEKKKAVDAETDKAEGSTHTLEKEFIQLDVRGSLRKNKL
jgi:hypothetical protein